MNLFLENKKLNEEEFNKKKIFLQSKPLTLRLILTNQCNINCIMCNIMGQGNRFTVPYDVIKQISPLLPYLERIDWQGGEVFLVDYFEKMLQEVSCHPNIHQTIQTNGLLLDTKWAELLAKYDIGLLISVDGSRQDTYEYIRKGARFEDLLKNIRKFNEYKNKYNSKSMKILCVCIMRSNYQEIEEFVDFAIKYEFNQISFGAIHGTNAFNEDIFYHRDSQAIDYLKKKLPIIEIICQEKGIILECLFKAYLKDSKDDSTEIFGKNHYEGRAKCKFPWTNLCIDAIRGGNIYPECLCSQRIENILTTSLFEIWNAPLMQQYRLAIAIGDSKHICSDYCLKFS